MAEVEIESLKKTHKELEEKLSDPGLISNWEKFEEISRKKSHLDKIINKLEEIEELKAKIEENKKILAADESLELASLAEEELKIFLERKKILENELRRLAKNEERNDPESIIVEIRAGTGGDEASLFVADLFRAYSKYAQSKEWKQRILSSHPTELGGFKEVIFSLKDGDVYSKMKYEGGVHRVQRIPVTEKNGRIHTSTISVAILPKPKKTDLKIKPDELKIDFYRSSGPGGQNVNRRETAVRITHLPTGLVVTSQAERNQLQNKENAMAILEARLLELKERRNEEEIHGKRKAQIGLAKRAEKIRTYNFPQNRLTDHRIKKSWRNLEEIFEGNLDPVIKNLSANL